MGVWLPRIVVVAVFAVASLGLSLSFIQRAPDAAVMPATAPETAQASAAEANGGNSGDAASNDGIQATEAVQPSAPEDCRALLRRPGSFSAWNPAGPKRVGIQAGHWRTQEAPDELARLRPQTGTSAGGYTEWEVNLDIARQTAALLAEVGVEAEVLPTTLPLCYRAHAFVSVHADGDTSGVLNGFKVARPRASMIPAVDDALVAALNQQYAAATGLPRDDDHISGRMLNYYAFNIRRFIYAIAPDVPGAIIETGFLTNASDRAFLTNHAGRAAAGIANGILQFLGMSERVAVP